MKQTLTKQITRSSTIAKNQSKMELNILNTQTVIYHTLNKPEKCIFISAVKCIATRFSVLFYFCLEYEELFNLLIVGGLLCLPLNFNKNLYNIF